MKREVRVKNRLAHAKRSIDDVPVKGDLAVTPAQMQRMAANGVAISSQLAGDFHDGEPNPSFDVPVGQVRGMDIVDYWEAQKVARRNVKEHISANKSKYGDSTLTQST